jgi:hypothetical protein
MQSKSKSLNPFAHQSANSEKSSNATGKTASALRMISERT